MRVYDRTPKVSILLGTLPYPLAFIVFSACTIDWSHCHLFVKILFLFENVVSFISSV